MQVPHRVAQRNGPDKEEKEQQKPVPKWIISRGLRVSNTTAMKSPSNVLITM